MARRRSSAVSASELAEAEAELQVRPGGCCGWCGAGDAHGWPQSQATMTATATSSGAGSWRTVGELLRKFTTTSITCPGSTPFGRHARMWLLARCHSSPSTTPGHSRGTCSWALPAGLGSSAEGRCPSRMSRPQQAWKPRQQPPGLRRIDSIPCRSPPEALGAIVGATVRVLKGTAREHGGDVVRPPTSPRKGHLSRASRRWSTSPATWPRTSRTSRRGPQVRWRRVHRPRASPPRSSP